MTKPAPSITSKLGLLRKIGLLGSLYFSQGLPYGFFTQVLPLILRKSGVSLGMVGLTSLLALPWAMKFLWAPAIDHYHSPKIGRRKSWIIPLQFCTLAILAALFTFSLMVTPSVLTLTAALLVLNLIAATQDIATDGLAIEMLTKKERGLANGVQIAGYRVGMIVGGGILLIFYEYLNFSGVFASMAALIATASVPILLTQEKHVVDHPNKFELPTTHHFLFRPGFIVILLVIIAYRAGDAFGTNMLRLFAIDDGLGIVDIAWLFGMVCFTTGTIGALIGGVVTTLLDRKHSIVIFGIMQCAILVACAYFAAGKVTIQVLYILYSLETLISVMAEAALFTCMMDWCSKGKNSGTDYTVQASTVVITDKLFTVLGGFSAQHLGYSAHFAIGAAMVFCGLVIIYHIFPTEQAQYNVDPTSRASNALS